MDYKCGLQHRDANSFQYNEISIQRLSVKSRLFWRTEAFLLAEEVPGLDKARMAFLNLQRVERLQHQLHLYTKSTRWKKAQINPFFRTMPDF